MKEHSLLENPVSKCAHCRFKHYECSHEGKLRFKKRTRPFTDKEVGDCADLRDTNAFLQRKLSSPEERLTEMEDRLEALSRLERVVVAAA